MQSSDVSTTVDRNHPASPNWTPPPSPPSPKITRAEKATKERDQKRQQVFAKLHPDLAAVVERLEKKNATPTAAEARFVSDGKAEVQIFLTSKSDALMTKLKQLGVEVITEPAASKLILGRIALDKLAALAEVA